jgi:hypothetical protein
MKYIILSFDDGRKDNYETVYPLLKKYGFTASFHIVTGFADGTAKAKFETMDIDNVKELARNGFDISSHSDKHVNEENDLRTSLQKLKLWGIDRKPLIFSSPNSDIYEGNIPQYFDMLRNNRIEYVRSGVQIRRNGLCYIILCLLQLYTKSKRLYYFLNKSNIMKFGGGGCNSLKINGLHVVKSVAVKTQNTAGQLIYMVKKLQPDDAVCFLFHSVSSGKDIEDDYAFELEKFEVFLNQLKNDAYVKVLNLSEYINL